ncbi:glycosyltransferase [Microbacterium sp.]|uniref:glycosyltransferase n=1 Tax=Microbacterium sp. TaxID=51671 RepID=UPI00273586F5|nr:glycosyltransferase [Microbacterium sp.]
MNQRILVLLAVQPSVSHYRAPFVRALLEQPDIEFELVGRINRGAGATSDPLVASDDILTRVTALRRMHLFRALFWDRGLVTAVRRTSAAAIVIEGNVYGLSNWVAIGVARIRQRHVVLWGHAWKRPERGVKLVLRRFFYGLADGHLTYGEWAPAYAGSVGLDSSTFMPVFNSIYQSDLIAMQTPRNARPSVEGALSLIYSGRLTPRHRVHQAIEAVCALNDKGHDVRLTIVGDGPESTRLTELAGDTTRVAFLGAVYDSAVLGQLYAEADFALSPGATGLNVIQALGFGVPVIAASGDPQSGPEVEAVEDGVTGVLYASRDASAGLERTILRAINMRDESYAELSAKGLQIVAARYTSEAQAAAVNVALAQLLTDARKLGADAGPNDRA